MSARALKSCASLMKVGPSDAIEAVSRSARRACTAAGVARGRPKSRKRRRSRRKARTKGSSRRRIVKPRRQRLMERAGRDRARPSGEEPRDDAFLELPHPALKPVVALGVILPQDVQGAVHGQAG